MHIYFSGIGGVGLGPLAEIALDAGYEVSGSDQADSPMMERLRKRGAQVHVGQDVNLMRDVNNKDTIDWFIYTSALPDDHPELVFARRNSIPTGKRNELLAHIIDQKSLILIAAAGTHGKTTTTAILAWLAQQMGMPASYSIGAEVSFAPSGHYDPDSRFFFYEADEYDRNFLSFYPYLSLVTNVDYDHPDTYGSVSDYHLAFMRFIHQSQQLITWQGVAQTLNIPKEERWLHLAPQPDDNLPIAGRHNRQNAQLALQAMSFITGESMDQLKGLLKGFPGVSRRFEKLADNLYTDYGHHPVEIAATLQLARELSSHVVLVYQPHQNLRQQKLQNQYNDCTKLAEKIYWLPTYLTREDPGMEELKPQALIDNLQNRSNVHYSEVNDALWQQIQADRAAGKLVLVMGAGDIDAWVRKKLQ